MPIGDIVVLLILGVVVALCIRNLWKVHKAGGPCAGCSGGNCGTCGYGCSCTTFVDIDEEEKDEVKG